MKKTTLLTFALFLAYIWQVNAQAVNEPANWPNSNWTLNVIAHTGSGTQDIEADPTTDANFAYDDDDTGSGSHDELAAESPVIDLTAAQNAGENYIVISGEYVFNSYSSSEQLSIDYWDADANTWVVLHTFPNQDTPGAPTDNFCSGTPESYQASLDISGFTASQLSGFKYRIYYNDNTGGSTGWNYGFCFTSPTLYSTSTLYSAPQFTTTVNPDCNNNQFTVDVEVTDLGGASSVTVSDDQGSASQQLTAPGTVTFGPYAEGTNVTFTVTNDDDNNYSSSESVQYWCPPANDSCSVAMALTVYPQGGGAGNEITQSTENATASSMSQTSCDSFGTNLDLFYSFTAPNSGRVKVITGGAGGNNIEAAVYDSCGGTELACFNNSSEKEITGLTPGQTYILQVWHDDFNANSFTIVLEELLYTNPVFTLTPTGDCNNSEFTVDVEVTDLGGASSVTISDDQGSASQQLTAPGTVTFGPYPEGTNVTFTVTNDDDNNYTSSDSVEFFCPPAYDDCANAMALTVNQTCTPTTATNQGATDSGVPAPGCSLYQGGDVWFTVTPATDLDTLYVETSSVSGSSVTDTGMAIYTGDCSNLTEIACDDDSGSGLYSKIELTNVTAGTTYYVRVFEYGNNSFGEFGICAYSPNLSAGTLTTEDFNFWPNPTEDKIYFQANGTPERIEIISLQGQVLMSKNANDPQHWLDISELSKGIYLMNVYLDGKKGVYRIIKK